MRFAPTVWPFPRRPRIFSGRDDLCFKIRGKIFVTLALTAVPQKLCFKCTPDTFAELVEREDIRPAPYVGRYKWVILDRLDALSWDELQEFIRESYEMVAAKAPKKRVQPPNRKRKEHSSKSDKAQSRVEETLAARCPVGQSQMFGEV